MARNLSKRKCAGHTTSGDPCDAWAVRGATVCVTHGAAAPQVKQAAARNVALERAGRMVARAGVDLDPIAHLLDTLHQAAQLAAIWGVMVAALDATAEEEADTNGTLRGELGYMEVHDEDGRADGLHVMSRDRLLALNQSGMAQVHPFVVQFERAIDRRARIAKLCIDAGVEQRRVEIEQEKAELMAQVIRAVLEDPALELTAEQRRAGLASAAGQLRLVAG